MKRGAEEKEIKRERASRQHGPGASELCGHVFSISGVKKEKGGRGLCG